MSDNETNRINILSKRLRELVDKGAKLGEIPHTGMMFKKKKITVSDGSNVQGKKMVQHTF